MSYYLTFRIWPEKEMRLRESQNTASPSKKLVNGEDRSMPRGQKSRSAKDLYQAFKAKMIVEVRLQIWHVSTTNLRQ